MSKVYIPAGTKVVGRQQPLRVSGKASVESLISVTDIFRETLIQARVDKFWGHDLTRAGLLLPNGRVKNTDLEFLERHGVSPYEVVFGEPHNLLVFGGASNLWECLIGNGTATTAQTLTFFNNAEANLGVGDSTTAAAATQTDLQAGANKDRQPQEATFPSHTDGQGSAGPEDIIFKSQWGSAQGNFAWQEWGLFNATTGQRMLSRKVESLGTKVSGATWNLTVTLTLA